MGFHAGWSDSHLYNWTLAILFVSTDVAAGIVPFLYECKCIVGLIMAGYFLKYTYRTVLTLVAMSPTPWVARLVAPIIKTYRFDDEEFYAADGAPKEVQEIRKKALDALAASFDSKVGPKARGYNEKLRGLSDIRFTDTNRVPHAFQPVIRSKLRLGFIAEKSVGPRIVDVDGNESLDVSGSYGVNVCGYSEYKRFIKEGLEITGDLGPNVLGPLHPCVFDVLSNLKNVSGLDEVSFHMSGTEGVMCAVRLARFNTKRRLIIQFAGAYHGWWDGVQPGPGNERRVADVLTLKELSPASLRLIAARADEIAAVLISPLQGLNPGAPPPSDLVLMDAKVRATADKDDTYKNWLATLRKVCTDRNVPLVFDEVYTGFRMGPGGAQEYYGCQADMVVYGKTLGGGMPVGVVCGKKELMSRFDPNCPLRVSYVIGTFAAAPMALGPMCAFLKWATSAEAAKSYAAGNKKTSDWVIDTNKKFIAEDFPVRVDHLTTVWTCLFSKPGRYHWMFQYYMRDEGLGLSWVGTGRCLFSLDFTAADYAEVQTKLLNAARRMKADGWWWDGATPGQIKKALVSETVTAMFVPTWMRKSGHGIKKTA